MNELGIEDKRSISMTKLCSGLAEREVPLVSVDSNLADIVEVLTRFPHSRMVYVVDSGHCLKGTITLPLLIKHLFSGNHQPQIHSRLHFHWIGTETASDIMMKQPVTAGPEEEIGTVLNRMIDRHLDEIAVVDRENHLLADITVVDIIKFLTSSEQ